MAGDFRTNDLYLRNQNDGTWSTEWAKVWTDKNDRNLAKLNEQNTFQGNQHINDGMLSINRPNTTGGYARGLMVCDPTGQIREAGFSFYGEGSAPTTLSIGFGVSPWDTTTP